MARTQIKGTQVEDGSIKRSDLDVSTAGEAVIRKLIAGGTNVTLAQTGVDGGTGDVTVGLNFKITISATAPSSPATNDLWVDIS